MGLNFKGQETPPRRPKMRELILSLVLILITLVLGVYVGISAIDLYQHVEAAAKLYTDLPK
jgi:hypothetical protein